MKSRSIEDIDKYLCNVSNPIQEEIDDSFPTDQSITDTEQMEGIEELFNENQSQDLASIESVNSLIAVSSESSSEVYIDSPQKI